MKSIRTDPGSPRCNPRCETNDDGPCHCGTCEICGKWAVLDARGWHDDGDPMLTCADCEPAADNGKACL